jgi:hypothetical protein
MPYRDYPPTSSLFPSHGAPPPLHRALLPLRRASRSYLLYAAISSASHCPCSVRSGLSLLTPTVRPPPRAALPAAHPSSGRAARITASPAPTPRPGHRIDLDGVLFSPVLQGATTKATHRTVRRGPRALRRRALAGFAAISDEMIHILVQLSRSSNEYFRLHELRCSFILTKLYKLASLNS